MLQLFSLQGVWQSGEGLLVGAGRLLSSSANPCIYKTAAAPCLGLHQLMSMLVTYRLG